MANDFMFDGLTDDELRIAYAKEKNSVNIGESDSLVSSEHPMSGIMEAYEESLRNS